MLRSLLYTICCLCIAHSGFAQAAFFDPTFGTSGKVVVPFSGTEGGNFEGVVVQPDGKIIVGGNYNDKATIVRYNINGSLDASFALGGTYTSTTWTTPLYDIALQPDGKVLGVGETNIGEYVFYTVRLNTDGTPDVSFGAGGSVTTDLGSFSNDRGHDLVIQSDGKIVLVGETSPNNIGVVRLHSNGIIDSSFGTYGIEKSIYGNARDVAITPDGKIVICGYATASHGYSLMALRYMPNGILDTSFNHTGIVYNNSASWGSAVLVQPDSKILLLGSGGGNFFVVRYNVDGTVDNSFGTDGIASIDFYGRDDLGYDFCFTPDGKILITGASVAPDDKAELAITCLNGNGTVDHSFGNDGRLINAILGFEDYGLAIALQADGRIVVAGHSYRSMPPGNYRSPSISRYIQNTSSINNNYKPFYNLLLYPNPTNERLFVSSDEQVICARIANAIGCDIGGILFETSSRSFNMKELSSGIYFFRIMFEDGSVAIEKIVVQH